MKRRQRPGQGPPAVIAREVLAALMQAVGRAQSFGCWLCHARREITRPGACVPCAGAGRARRAPAESASARGSRGSSCDDGCSAETFASQHSPTSDAPPGRGLLARSTRPAGAWALFHRGRRKPETKDFVRLAERVGFEPTDRVNDQRFSRPPHSTALAPLRCSIRLVVRRRSARGAFTMAERVGFEPTVGFPLHTLSRRAPSATRSPLRSEPGCSN